MKEFYAILHLSPFAAFTIWTTVAVCLVGVSEAEVRPSYKQRNWELSGSGDQLNGQSIGSKSISTSQENLNAGGDEFWRPRNLAVKLMRNGAGPETGGTEKILKKRSSDDSEGQEESEGDGYGYDDDEYYHLEFKRNDENANSRTENKEAMQGDANKKEAFQTAKYNFGQKPMSPGDKDRETQTVEMLSFKETHLNPASDDTAAAKGNLAKPLAPNSGHKKTSNQPVSSLNMNDLKESSSIDEKMKDRKDESSGLGSSSVTGDQKGAEGTKSVKMKEEKDVLKLKESKYGEDSEKKEKEASVKESKESMAGKTSVKEDKEKLEGELKSGTKVSENIKLEEGLEKMSSKSKNGYTNENGEGAKLNGKLNTEEVSSNEVSKINNRVSFVSNDYKDNGNSLKTQGIDEDEKDSEEINEKHVGTLSDYEDEARGKEGSREGETTGNYEYRTSEGDNAAEVQQDNGKKNDYITIPIAFQVEENNLNNLYKGGSSWKEYATAQEPQDQPSQVSYPRAKGTPLQITLPQSELENTDYHKNYLKFLKKYKGIDEHSKVTGSNESNMDNSKSKDTKKRKRSKIIKRKSTNNENMNDIQQRMNAVNAVNNNQMKNIYNQLNSMQAFQQQMQQQIQQQQQQMQQQQSPSHPSPYGSKTPNGMNYMMNTYGGTKDSNRETRKSPAKVEYEIKIINQNQQDAGRDVPLLRMSRKRRKKNAVTNFNDRFSEKFIKQYPYSQVSQDDLDRFTGSKVAFSNRRFKRMTPAWQTSDELEFSRQIDESSSKNKGAPSGYYSNRVKFGQKHYVPKEGSGGTELNLNRISSFSNKKIPIDNFLQRSWKESKMQEAKHDAIKRFDETAVFGKNHQNSLLLVKKDRNGDRVAKTFIDANSKADADADMNSDQLAKILSKDNDYIVLKKTDKNKFQKIDDGQARSVNEETSSLDKKYDIFGLNKADSLRETNKDNRGLFIRSYRSNDQKLDNQETKSNLKKTFDKFKDFADLFKDNSGDTNQQSVQDVKETSEIVFSADKIPDPIVINQDLDGSTSNVKTKQNTMSSISNNFKQSDQEKKTNDIMKFEDSSKVFAISKEASEKSNWEPALKNIFPEAKSINSMQKNGNEIIVLDFDRNHLKTDQGNKVVLSKPLREQPPFDSGTDQLYLPFGSVQKTPNNPLNIAGNRQVDIVLNEGSLPTFLQPTSPINKNIANGPAKPNKFNPLDQSSNTMMASPNNQPVMTLPYGQPSHMPFYIKQTPVKKLNTFESGYKTVSKKSLPSAPLSDNFNQFLRDYQELSDLNKENSLPKKVKLNRKRRFNKNAHTEANIKDLSNLLQNIMNTAGEVDMENTASSWSVSNNLNSPVEQQQTWQLNSVERNVAAPQGQWITASDPQTPAASPLANGDKYFLNRMNDDVESFLGSDAIQEGTNEKDFQNDLLEELSATSDKIQRLRREGVAEKKLREIMEDALPFRGKRLSGVGSKRTSGSAVDKTDESNANSSPENYQEVEKKGEKTKRSLPTCGDKVPKSSQYTAENSICNRHDPTPLINSGESTGRNWRNQRRRKRSPASDSKTQVSKSEVENKILKNLEEDTDQSVYSPGITRKLLSVDGTEYNEEEADGPGGRSYLVPDEKEEKLTDKSRQGPNTCVKNAQNKCIDPIILDLFHSDDDDNNNEKQTRTRRNVFAASHSNYKREIDLDESLPNDFQNFLVTSLGLDSHVPAYGSQKREYRKDRQHDAYNSNTPKDDSPLEKREIPDEENLKRQNYKERSEYSDPGSGKLQTNPMQGSSSPGLKLKQDKPAVKSKTPNAEYEDSNMPTQIRIQITKASAKEKKSSSKSAVDDNEVPSNDMGIPSKEKDYFGKNKFASNSQKLVSMSKNKIDKYSMDLGDGNEEQKYYVMTHPYRRARRKKKKYIQENPMKPIKDFIAFDQKAMETLIRRYFADQNMQRSPNIQSSQKLPTANHLPQVETVYNPTQGTNKAQVESYKPLLKVNSLSNKNTANAKNSLQSNEASTYDEGMLRSYLQEKSLHVKNDKQATKEFENVDWKPYSMPRPTQNNPDNQPQIQNFKPYVPAAPQPFETNDISLMKKPPTQTRWYQLPNSNYMAANPSTKLSDTSAAGPSTKIKPGPQIWSPQGLNQNDGNMMKGWRKFPNYLNGSPYTKEKTSNAGTASVDEGWNTLDGYLNKKPSDRYKIHETFGKESDLVEDPAKIRYHPYKYSPYAEEMKSGVLEPQTHSLEGKDSDYADPSDEEYLDSEDLKQEPQFDVDSAKTDEQTNRYSNLFGYKNVDLDDVLNDEDEEMDEDYDENAEDNMEDYSLLSSPNLLQPELSKKETEENDNLRGSYYADDSPYSSARVLEPPLQGSNAESMELTSSKLDERLEPAPDQMTLTDVKTNVDSFGSSAVLKNANQNSNVLGKNLMKNLNRYSYDDGDEDPSNGPNKFMENRMSMRDYRNPEIRNGEKFNKKKLNWQSKLKRSQGMSPIGSRLFYASKMELPDSKEPTSLEGHVSKRRNDRNVYYHMPKRNPRNVLFHNSEFDCDLDNDHRYFTSNLVNGDRQNDGVVQKDGSNDDNKSIQPDSTNSENVQDNLEDTISGDNVLENVIGKYIMRKSVSVKPRVNAERDKDEPEELKGSKLVSEDSRTAHPRQKRSLSDRLYSETHQTPKIWRKRLSSGHLTEKNFQKYHKKNVAGELRKIRGLNTKFLASGKPVFGFDFTEETINLIPETTRMKLRKQYSADSWEDSTGKKRSALNLFRRFGCKDRDSKKEDAMNVRTVGFEPILSTADSKFELTRSDALVKQPLATVSSGNAISSLETSSLADKKKEKSKIENSKNEGPWKIDLNEKYTEKSPDGNSKDNASNDVNMAGSLPGNSVKAHFTPADNSDDVKAFLVIRKNGRNVDQTENVNCPAEDVFLSGSGTSKREKIGDSRHVNEETSEYLGQQIVDAILTKVNKNPRFKKMIEPGLTGKLFKKKEDNNEENVSRDEDYPSQQVQSLLQKVVFDIEKIAERHVKKRMCNKIDKRSEEFLHSLLEVPDGSCSDEEKEEEDQDAGSGAVDGAAGASTVTETPDVGCSHVFSTVNLQSQSDSGDDREEAKTFEPVSTPPSSSSPTSSSDLPDNGSPDEPSSSETTSEKNSTPSYSNAGERVAHFNDKMCETLKKKQNTLRKLIEDYHRLSELEKQTISVSFQYLKTELEQTTQLLSSLNGEKSHTDERCVKEDSKETVKKNDDKFHMEVKDKGFEGGTKCELQNITIETTTEKEPASSSGKPQLKPIVFHFEPTEKDGGPGGNDNSTQESTNSQTSVPHQVLPPQDQGFESVTDKSDPLQAFDAMPTQAPLTNRGKLKGYSSPVFVRLKTDREKTGRINKDDLSRIDERTATQTRNTCQDRTAFPTTYLKPKESIKESPDVRIPSADRLTAYDGDWPAANDREGPDLFQRERFEDPYDKHLLDELSKNLLMMKKNVDSNWEKVPVDGFEGGKGAWLRGKRNHVPTDCSYRRKLTECKHCREKTEDKDTEFEENPRLEYLIWSSMPLVRRRLNNLELGDEIPRIPFQGTRKRK